MFGIKKKKTEKEAVVEKASEIVGNINFALLRTAWEEYRYIRRQDPAYDKEGFGENLYPTPEWFALKKLIEYGGDFTKFDIYELPLLKSLKEGYLVYDEVMHVLMDHHDDEDEAKRLFLSHPNLHNHLPAQFNNNRQVIEVLVEVVNQFRWEIEHFSEAYKEKVAEAIPLIIKQASKKAAEAAT